MDLLALVVYVWGEIKGLGSNSQEEAGKLPKMAISLSQSVCFERVRRQTSKKAYIPRVLIQFRHVSPVVSCCANLAQSEGRVLGSVIWLETCCMPTYEDQPRETGRNLQPWLFQNDWALLQYRD